jgi:UDPglucose--hexose-1-phosphate uridylyltransferase
LKTPDPLDLYREPHRRLNPLTGEWVLVSPHRSRRPWRGQTETPVPPAGLAYDPSCYLCPGNERAGGARNPNYSTTFVFTNDFAALKPDVPAVMKDESGRGLMVSQSEAGTCRVVCFSPRHDLTLARMTMEEVLNVVDVWCE